MTFHATLDGTAKTITVIVTLVFIAIIGFSIADPNRSFGALLIAALLAVTYAVCWLLRPLRYTITKTDLQIERPIGKITISLKDINSVAILQHSDISGAIRTFGVGGLFGYYGKFHNRTFGSMTWYLTRTDKAVLITTPKSKIMVSPEEAELFTETLRKIN